MGEAPPCPSSSCCDNGCCRRTASLAKTLLCEEEKQAFYLVSIMAVVNQLCASTSIINYGPTILNEVLLASSGDSSEVFSMRTKAAAASIVTSILFTAGAVADFTFLSLMDFMGYWSFLIYAAICIAGGVYLQFKLPETQGKTLVEVQELLRKPQVSCFRAQEFAELGESDKGIALGVDEDGDDDYDLEQQQRDEYEDAEVAL